MNAQLKLPRLSEGATIEESDGGGMEHISVAVAGALDRLADRAGLDTGVPFHPLADIFPLIEGEQLNELAEDIRAHGLHEPIVLLDGQIIDGRNRYRACRVAEVKPEFRLFDGHDGDPLAFVISANLRRRHLDESQRAMVAGKVANLPRGGAIYRSANWQTDAVSSERAGEMFNVSTRSVDRARKLIEHGLPDLIRMVEAGELSVSAASDIAGQPVSEQQALLALILKTAGDIRAARAERRKSEIEKIRTRAAEIPAGKFGTIIIDPPWNMQKIERDVRPNQVAFDYPTMSEEELAEFPVAGMAADDCHLFCWTTQKFLPPALRLVEAWGFRYCLVMVWHKPGGFQPVGLPQFNCEFVVYARRGSPAFADTKAFPCAFYAERREHSRKPDEFYELIARVTDGPRIDVFSREPREGFAQFGNEIEKFAA